MGLISACAATSCCMVALQWRTSAAQQGGAAEQIGYRVVLSCSVQERQPTTSFDLSYRVKFMTRFPASPARSGPECHKLTPIQRIHCGNVVAFFLVEVLDM